MAVQQSRNRRDTIIFVGPLDECFAAAQSVVADYTGRNWLVNNSRAEPNNGPRLVIVFTKENE